MPMDNFLNMIRTYVGIAVGVLVQFNTTVLYKLVNTNTRTPGHAMRDRHG